jgi:hypothetical protein
MPVTRQAPSFFNVWASNSKRDHLAFRWIDAAQNEAVLAGDLALDREVQFLIAITHNRELTWF